MKWFQWLLLVSLTGGPILSLLILLVVWWTIDHFTFGVLPDPLRGWARWQRVSRLRSTIATNPHDRRARRELADILVEQRRFKEASSVLEPSLAAGDDDMSTVYLAGVALYGAGEHEKAEKFLLGARQREPGFRMGSIDLELGRGRLARGDAKGSIEALERFCAARPSSVEGKVLLAKALAKAGEAKRAAETKKAAWQDYAAAPVFQRRRERFWAWRANPKRPLGYALAAGLVALAFARWGAPALTEGLDDAYARPGRTAPSSLSAGDSEDP